jgi:hypothetical protein
LTPFWLPAEPLIEQVLLRGGVRECETRTPALESLFQQVRRSGRVTVWAADKLAVQLLGEHPMMVWGDEWLYGPRDESAHSCRRTSCRPGWGPPRRRHEHASQKRAATG